MAVDELAVACQRTCIVLRHMADELEAEENLNKARLLRAVVRGLERELAQLGTAPTDHTPIPGSTYVERLFAALEDPRGYARPVVLRWLRRRWHEAIVLVREALKALEVYGGAELELIEAAKRWLDRVVEGPSEIPPE